ncbi:MAG TPA: enoyl-CoA hydratase-related protein [Mycobacteriales bacterium]
MSEVLVEVRPDGVATLTLAAPDRRNALTPEMADAMVAACDALDADESVGAVVVQGQGAAFCAGAHRGLLAAVAKDPAADEAYGALTRIYAAFTRVGRLLAPTIAAVRGPAVGAGMNLVLATDLRVVAHDVRLASGFLPIGAHPGGGHFTLLARTGGREVAAGIGLFGAALTGREAVARGLAWTSTPDDEVEAEAIRLASTVAGDPQLARLAARSFRLQTGPPGVGWDVGVQVEHPAQMWSFRRGPLGRTS